MQRKIQIACVCGVHTSSTRHMLRHPERRQARRLRCGDPRVARCPHDHRPGPLSKARTPRPPTLQSSTALRASAQRRSAPGWALAFHHLKHIDRKGLISFRSGAVLVNHTLISFQGSAGCRVVPDPRFACYFPHRRRPWVREIVELRQWVANSLHAIRSLMLQAVRLSG